MKKSAIFIASATIAIFINGCITIAHNILPDFKQLLATLTGHHWVSVSIIIIVLFALSSLFLSGSKSARKSIRVYDISLWSSALMAVTLLMMLGIFAELVVHYLSE